jgi:glycosyltransferase involved in cell wall biosynthesis
MTPANRRVLVVARWPVGGIRTYLRDLFSAPALAGYELILVAPNDEGLDEFIASGQLKAQRWIRTDSSPAAFIRTIYRAIRTERPGFVHSHGFFSGAYTAAACLASRCVHLLTVHDVLLDSQFAGFKGNVQRMILGATLAKPDRVHCVTQDSLDNLMDRFPALRADQERFVVIPHGVDTVKIMGAAPRDVHAELGTGAATIFGFLGRFMAQKGFRCLIDAVALVRDGGVTAAQMRVLAVGSGAFQRQDQARVRDLGLDHYFTFWPYQPDIASILKGIDCLVMPSLWEASGLLAMEAMVAATPVLGSSCIGLRETLGNTPALQLPPGDAPALAKAMREFMDAPTTARARDFQAEAADRFSAERCFSALRAVYDQTTAGMGAGMGR